MNMHIVAPSPSSMLAIGISLGRFLSLFLYVLHFILMCMLSVVYLKAISLCDMVLWSKLYMCDYFGQSCVFESYLVVCCIGYAFKFILLSEVLGKI